MNFKKQNAENNYKAQKTKPFYSGIGPYIKPKAKKRISFTEALRNKKGYDKYLALRFNL